MDAMKERFSTMLPTYIFDRLFLQRFESHLMWIEINYRKASRCPALGSLDFVFKQICLLISAVKELKFLAFEGCGGGTVTLQGLESFVENAGGPLIGMKVVRASSFDHPVVLPEFPELTPKIYM